MSTNIQKAHGAVNRAVATLMLPPPSACEACGQTVRVVYHHWSYGEMHWLDVIPLCRTCHRKVHMGKLAEPRTGRIYEQDVEFKTASYSMAARHRKEWTAARKAARRAAWEARRQLQEIADRHTSERNELRAAHGLAPNEPRDLMRVHL